MKFVKKHKLPEPKGKHGRSAVALYKFICDYYKLPNDLYTLIKGTVTVACILPQAPSPLITSAQPRPRS